MKQLVPSPEFIAKAKAERLERMKEARRRSRRFPRYQYAGPIVEGAYVLLGHYRERKGPKQ